MALLSLSRLLAGGHHPRYEQGLRHLARAEFERAIGCFDALRAEAGPEHRDLADAAAHARKAHVGMALACFQAREYARAERELSVVLDVEDVPGLRYLMARIYERSGRLPEARADLARAIGADPGFLEALLLLAVCLDQAGERDAATAALDRALALGFDPPAGLPATRGDLAVTLLAQERAVDANPGYADLRCALAGSLLDAGRPVEALAELAAALRIHPRYLEARRLAVRACLERGDAVAAVAHARVLT
ncbi:MAG TPA: tetratricopeptide repeat protein, partial [Candidatus Eisenbacteria bacterium]|nr:tetratricopeptide repeat protein [Candidatus Eisenbacteria bacterium]